MELNGSIEDNDKGEGTSSVKILDPKEAASVQKKVFHALKEMGRAFKKARDFELRKIIKRIKEAEYET